MKIIEKIIEKLNKETDFMFNGIILNTECYNKIRLECISEFQYDFLSIFDLKVFVVNEPFIKKNQFILFNYKKIGEW